jgi:Domain of unknown function (DUF4062)
VALVAHDDGEVVEALGGARMVRPRSGLIDCQGGLVEGAGGVGVALVVQNARGWRGARDSVIGVGTPRYDWPAGRWFGGRSLPPPLPTASFPQRVDAKTPTLASATQIPKGTIVEREPERPVIDHTSPARRLTGEEVYSWAQTQRVFISSVMGELAKERRAVAAAVEEMGATPVWFEALGGRDEGAEAAYLDGVRRADVYLGIIADRYGALTPTGRSATHEEYREAIRLGKRIAVWVRADGSRRQGDAREFVDEVRLFHTTGTFTGPDDLAADVRRRLEELAAEDLAPWVKLGSVIFRASRVVDASDRMEVEAIVRDPVVRERLLSLRGDQWGRSQPVQFTDPFGSRPVTVSQVTATTTARSSQEFAITLQADGRTSSGHPSQRMTVNTLSPDDVVEQGLRHRLLGEDLPAALDGFGFLLPKVSLAPIHDLPPDIAGAVAHLLLAEALVGDGHATTVQTRLGGGSRGGYRILVEWQPPAWAGAAPASRRVEGRLVEEGAGGRRGGA